MNYFQKNFAEFIDILCVAADCGIFSVRMDADFTLLYGSEKYYEIHEYTKESMLEKIQNKCIRYVYPDDIEQVRNYCQRAIEDGKSRIEWEMRVITGKGNVRHMKCSGAVIMVDGAPTMHGVLSDITDKEKLQEENEINENTIQTAIDQTNIVFWTYDFNKKCIIQNRNSKKYFGYEYVVDDIPRCIFSRCMVHPSDQYVVKKMFDELLSGEKTTTSVARWKRPSDGSYWWAKIVYTTMFDKNGRPVKAIGSAIDVSEQMELQEKYEKQMSYKSIMEENIMGSFHLNLTQNICSEGQSVYSYILKLQEDGTVDGFFKRVYPDIPDEEARRYYSEHFNRQNMIESFAGGVSHFSQEHRYRVSEDRFEWIVTHVNITKNPVTGDIEALIYTFNIHHTKLIQQLMEHTVENDYDYVALVDLHNENHIDIIKKKNNGVLPQIQQGTYSEIAVRLIQEESLPDDRGFLLHAKSLSTIVAELQHQDIYTLVYKALHHDGSIHQKRLRHSYLDKDAGLIAISATDITAAMEAEQKKNELLSAALAAAKQASSAKTDFLSRMSHEIRTPMNAIIGMTAIAAQSIGNVEQLTDCLAKIGLSSRFLLTLINDILDMSRIESGKVLLKNEKIPFVEFIGSINSICYAQAKAKDVDYECTVDGTVEESYLGDAMKLQQVLINLLSNAIKFTGPHGRVSIDIRQIKKTENNATLLFTVNDTGCGINPDFIPHLYEPFSQEHSVATPMYGGTGLGLAICKNLVELMDGKIEVRSIVGVGTEFTITVKLNITEETKIGYLKNIVLDLNKLNALVVDDDVTACLYTVNTLKEIGMTAEGVDSGKKAVEQVTKKWAQCHSYDVILLDWKMPDMDGIETAKELRKIVGPEVSIIIMTAYDWSAIEYEAKLAGVNLLISKPLFKSSLISAFHKVFKERSEEAMGTEEKSVDFDFTGHRVLLVEDHPLNVAVAKKLLECKGFQVECAENGLRAIEMVTLTPDSYYDVILMDIRMPVMDGLQAAQGIRNLNKNYVSSVPIIAMTANAFDDDVEKSKKVGMNAHLAKPIDIKQLYSTLHHYIFEKNTCRLSD